MARQYEADLIELYLSRFFVPRERPYVFVELGAGLTTQVIAKHAERFEAAFYSCDEDEERLIRLAREVKYPVNFCQGTTTEGLHVVRENEDHVDFLFMDAAPSAMLNFIDFQIMEDYLEPGSLLIMDNACRPSGAGPYHGPCRKGKIVVPYLEGHKYWEVIEHSNFGGSMIAAVRHDEPRYVSSEYEHPRLGKGIRYG